MARFEKGIIPWNKGKKFPHKRYFCSICKKIEILRKAKFCSNCRKIKGFLEVVCLICHIVFKKHKANIKKNPNHYCSRQCYYKAVSERQQGEKHHLWKGKKAGYHAIHRWLRKKYSHVKTKCEECGYSGKLHFALKKEYSHDRNVDHYFRLCVSCHMKYDGVIKNLNPV